MLDVGDKIPDLPIALSNGTASIGKSPSGSTARLSDYKGDWLVLLGCCVFAASVRTLRLRRPSFVFRSARCSTCPPSWHSRRRS